MKPKRVYTAFSELRAEDVQSSTKTRISEVQLREPARFIDRWDPGDDLPLLFTELVPVHYSRRWGLNE